MKLYVLFGTILMTLSDMMSDDTSSGITSCLLNENMSHDNHYRL